MIRLKENLCHIFLEQSTAKCLWLSVYLNYFHLFSIKWCEHSMYIYVWMIYDIGEAVAMLKASEIEWMQALSSEQVKPFLWFWWNLAWALGALRISNRIQLQNKEDLKRKNLVDAFHVFTSQPNSNSRSDSHVSANIFFCWAQQHSFRSCSLIAYFLVFVNV